MDMLELIKGKYLVLIDFIINIFFNLINCDKNYRKLQTYIMYSIKMSEISSSFNALVKPIYHHNSYY